MATFNTAGCSGYSKNGSPALDASGSPDGRRLGTTATMDVVYVKVRSGHDSARRTVETVRPSGVMDSSVLLSQSMSTPNAHITRRPCAYTHLVYLCPLETIHPRTCSYHPTPYPGHFGILAYPSDKTKY